MVLWTYGPINALYSMTEIKDVGFQSVLRAVFCFAASQLLLCSLVRKRTYLLHQIIVKTQSLRKDLRLIPLAMSL